MSDRIPVAGLTLMLLEQLEQARQRRELLTYRQLLEALPLPTPRMQSLARLLERLAEQDARQGRPLRSTLVVSQTDSNLPRAGFFQHLAEVGVMPVPAGLAAAKVWHAQEVQHVFEFSYQGEA